MRFSLYILGLVSYRDILILISHGNDTYKLISIVECQKGFERRSFLPLKSGIPTQMVPLHHVHHAQQHFQMWILDLTGYLYVMYPGLVLTTMTF